VEIDAVALNFPQWREAVPENITRIPEVARALGVTRFADVTRLDRLGLPVWQAIRPMSKSMSVHQGKAWSAISAKLGAAMEGIESAAAEQPIAVTLKATPAEIAAQDLAFHISDYFFDRSSNAKFNPVLDWTELQPLIGTAAFLAPTLCISMDFTVDIDTPLDRCSNGLAGGGSRAEALVSAICETIERDFCAQWRAESVRSKLNRQLDLSSINLPWFQQFLSLLETHNLTLMCWDVSYWPEFPTFHCRLVDLSNETGFSLPATEGWSCHPDPCVALSSCILEAVQSRLTIIAGARDDIEPMNESEKRNSQLLCALDLLTPTGHVPRQWFASERLEKPTPDILVDFILHHLAARGVTRLGYYDLTCEAYGLPVMKVIWPGAGMDERSSRFAKAFAA
jgi:ribosomal protein S12 methylthiotransferase accessory factor